MFTESDLVRGWTVANEERTKAFLGDRNYIGMSDVGKAFGCPRAAVAGKVRKAAYYPSIEELLSLDPTSPHDQARLIEIIRGIRPLERGHEQEYGLAASFRGLGHNFLEQLEIRIVHKKVPIHAHLDFTLFKKGNVHVAESKSNEIVPDEVYPEYKGQLDGQMGLLYKHWGDSVFSVKDEQGKYIVEDVTLSKVADHFFNLKLPKKPTAAWSVDGCVISMGMKEMKVFGTYTPSDLRTKVVLNKAVYIWEMADLVKRGICKLDEVEYKRGHYILCDYCGHSWDCPKYTDVFAMPELESVIGQMDQQKDIRNKAEKAMKLLQEELKKAFALRKIDPSKHISTGKHRFRHAVHDKWTLKEKLLEEELVEEGFDLDEAKDLIERSKVRTEYRRLYVSKVANKAA